MKKRFSKQELREAAGKAARSQLEALPQEFPAWQMDRDALSRLRNYERRCRRRRTVALTLKRIGAAGAGLAACLVLVLTLGLEARTAMLAWTQENLGDGFFIRFLEERSRGEKPEIQVGWVPEDLERQSQPPESTGWEIHYASARAPGRGFTLYALNPEQSDMALDEGYSRLDVTVNGQEAAAYESLTHGDLRLLFWYDGDSQIAFRISSTLTLEETLAVAESIRVEK